MRELQLGAIPGSKPASGQDTPPGPLLKTYAGEGAAMYGSQSECQRTRALKWIAPKANHPAATVVDVGIGKRDSSNSGNQS